MNPDPRFLDFWPDFLTERKVLELLGAGSSRANPVPEPPPDSCPRPGNNNEAEKRVVGPGERVWMTIDGSDDQTVVVIAYPSSFEESISYFRLESWFTEFGVVGVEPIHLCVSYLTNFRRVVFYPNERKMFLRVDFDYSPWDREVSLSGPATSPLLPLPVG